MRTICAICAIGWSCAGVILFSPAHSEAVTVYTTRDSGEECSAARAADNEQVVRMLGSTSSKERLAAAWEAARRKLKGAISPLKRLLGDAEERIRYAAAVALLDMNDVSGIAVIGTRLRSDSQFERSIAARRLAEHGDLSGIEIGRANLKHEHSAYRGDAVVVLSYSADPHEAMDALQAGAQDPVVLVRITTARCLGRRADDASFATLSTLLDDDTSSVRAAAMWALGDTLRFDAIPLLLSALSDAKDSTAGIASAMLKKITGHSPVARGGGSEAANRKLQAEWRTWWEANKADYPPGGKAQVPAEAGDPTKH